MKGVWGQCPQQAMAWAEGKKVSLRTPHAVGTAKSLSIIYVSLTGKGNLVSKPVLVSTRTQLLKMERQLM